MSFEIPQTPRAKTRYREEVEATPANDDGFDTISVTGEVPAIEHKSGTTHLDPLTPPPRYSISPFSEHGGRVSPAAFRGSRGLAQAPLGTRSQGVTSRVKSALRGFWARHHPVLYVLVGQLFGTMMNLFARLLETDDDHKMHPLQLLFIRMGLTMVLGSSIMYWRKTPEFPFGKREIRWLLVLRGMSGFLGIFCMWYSLMYLPLAEATVITFLVPSLSGYVCHLTLHDPFTRKEQIASFIALGGVVLIARPASLFAGSDEASTPVASPVEIPGNLTAIAGPEASHAAADGVTSTQHLIAIGVALLGIVGGTGAFTTIRAIGKRADPLISVNYFATWVTFATGVAMTVAPFVGKPDWGFDFPQGLRQWALIMSITLTGFLMQLTLTSGLRAEKSNRATAMVYTQMLFAAAFDKWFFGQDMAPVSVFGCGLIIGSALWVALTKKAPVEKPSNAVDVENGNGADVEAIPMLDNLIDSDEEEEAGLDVNHRLSGR